MANVFLMVLGSVFDGWSISASRMVAVGVLPVHPFGSGTLNVVPVLAS